MKIGVITETYPPEVNGVAMTLSRLVKGLVARGFSVQVIRPRQKKDDYTRTQDALHQEVVTGFPLPGYEGLHFGMPSNRQLKKLWLKERPDIIYIATEGPLGLFARRLAERMGIVVCSGFHTNFQTYMQHYKLGLIGRLAMNYLRSFHNKTRATFVPSQDAQKQLEEAGFLNVKILGRGVDTELFSPARRSSALRASWGATEDTPVFVYVGRVAAEKNIDLTVQAFQQAQQLLPDAQLVIVGDGPERARLQQSFPWIHFAGMQTGEALAAHYASGDVFLFASVTETFGNVVTEAMASGLVVQAFDYAAPQACIEHAQNGFLVPYNDAPAFLAQTKTLVEARSQWTAIKEASRTTALGMSWQNVLDMFVQDLEELLASR